MKVLERHYTLLDRVCSGLDQAVRALAANVKTTGADYPAKSILEQELNPDQRKQSAALMRVNHAGEICAQALYHGQGLASNQLIIQSKMQKAALEEGDHLAWCQQRLEELESHASYLNPLWYTGSFCIGMAAGLIGDQWSLGFLAETERQVIKHLEGHLEKLPTQDQRSYVILQRMEADEARHRDEALALGAQELPGIVKSGMRFTAKIMVNLAYYI